MEQNLKYRISNVFSTGNSTISSIKGRCIILNTRALFYIEWMNLWDSLWLYEISIVFFMIYIRNYIRVNEPNFEKQYPHYTIQRTFHDIQKLGHKLLYRDLCPFWTWGPRWALGSRWASRASLEIERTSGT